MEIPTKSFWDFYNEIEPVYYSNQLEPKAKQIIVFDPNNIKVQKDNNNNSNQNVVFSCQAMKLYLIDDIIQNARTELRLPRKTFVKMFRKKGINLRQYAGRDIRLEFSVKNKFRYELISIE